MTGICAPPQGVGPAGDGLRPLRLRLEGRGKLRQDHTGEIGLQVRFDTLSFLLDKKAKALVKARLQRRVRRFDARAGRLGPFRRLRGRIRAGGQSQRRSKGQKNAQNRR